MANTTADKLDLLEATKADLKAALAEKGQTVGDVFSTYPAAVRAIETGGGSVTITIGSNFADSSYIAYTTPEGSAELLTSPKKGQSFTALEGSACCVIAIGSASATGIVTNLPANYFLFANGFEGDVFGAMVTLSSDGTISFTT